MKPIPAKVRERLISGIKKFSKILEDAKARDINESDTVVIVTDMLSYLFGYEKYSEITSEFTVRGTYCDLATRIDGKLQYLIEVKAIGNELKENFIKQAIDYAANEGVDWVILTNGLKWIVFKVTFSKPIDKEKVIDIDFNQTDYKNEDHLETLFCLSKEGCGKSVLEDFHIQQQVLSKHFIGNVILTEPILIAIKKELKKLAPDVKTDIDQISKVIIQEVLKREIFEGEKAEEVTKKISRLMKKQKRVKVKEQKQPIVKTDIVKKDTIEVIKNKWESDQLPVIKFIF